MNDWFDTVGDNCNRITSYDTSTGYLYRIVKHKNQLGKEVTVGEDEFEVF